MFSVGERVRFVRRGHHCNGLVVLVISKRTSTPPHYVVRYGSESWLAGEHELRVV